MATYTVKSGDTFGEIAQRYGLSVSQLKSINPQKEDINRIEIGERIIIPGGAESTVQETVASAETPIANKQKDFAILNPELSYLFRKDPEVGVGRTGTYVNVPMEQQPIGPDTIPEMPEGFQMPKQEYSYGQLASDIGGTLKEKVGDPLMSGLQYLNQNVLQKSMGGDQDPVEEPVEILKKDPVPEAAQIIKDSAEFVRQETPLVVEETLKKIPLTDKELKENLEGVDENLNLMPEDVDQDFTQGGSVTEDNKTVALKIASDLSSGTTPVVESTETTIEEPQGGDLEQELPQQISIQDINNLEKSGQITPKTKEAFDNYLEGGFEFFGNTAIIKKIDKEIEANRVRLQEISRGEIKPFFGKEDTGKKIMAAIAAGLGAYASAITGGPNSALQIINDAIDRDLAVQKEKLERQRMAIIDQNDFLQQQKADLLAYAELELDRMSTIAGTKNDALKDELALLKANQEIVLNAGKIRKQEREETQEEFIRNVKIADGQETQFNSSVSNEEAPRLKRDIKRFVSGYNVLVGAPNLAESVADQIIDPLSYSETFRHYEFTDKDGIKRNTQRKKKFADKKLQEESEARMIDGVVITDNMLVDSDPVNFTSKGIINQLKDLSQDKKIDIVAGGKLTKAGVKILQLDTFLRNYYQRYIMVTGANLTGTEVLQVSDILPRPSKYAIASGNYLEGLRETENLLKSLYTNEVLAYVELPKKRRVQKPKSKLKQKDLKYKGDAT
jgi:murein DD-endopeptidase MepM/ murein hydrolase activator NlpD